MKNRKLIITLTIISAVAYLGTDMNVKRVGSKVASKSIERTPANATDSKATVLMERKPDSFSEAIHPRQKNINLRKSRRTRSFEGTHHASLPPSYIVASTVFVLKKNQYEPHMGALIEERNGFVFFESPTRPSVADPAIYDSKNDRLYSISSVIKLTDIDDTLRSEIVSKGYREYYYSEELKTLYVQSSQDEVFETYDDLASLNLNPKVELLRNFHRPK